MDSIKIRAWALEGMLNDVILDIDASFASKEALLESKERINEYLPEYIGFLEYRQKYSKDEPASEQEQEKMMDFLSRLSDEERRKMDETWGSSGRYVEVKITLSYGRPSIGEYHTEQIDSREDLLSGKWQETR